MGQELSPDTILQEALELSDSQARVAYLDEVCGDDEGLRAEIESLLAAHFAADAFMNTLADPVWTETPTEQEGDSIGRYKLLQQIGEGGFGTVYMAEQTEPVKRRVALKVIKAGMDSKEVIARFEAERQALALMDHPNIAKVHDAGTTEGGRPYFVMELVKGIPLTKDRSDKDLDTKGRLELFTDVCAAVQHAHQKGIIHRDLKPSNIMVSPHDGKPVVKVIDFGIAKAISMQLTEKTVFTQLGRMIGTPQYMSPEQAELNALDVDTRSDIYSLGVVLYELLTGSTPLEGEQLRSAAYGEMQRLIREETPQKPSTRLSDSLSESELSNLSHSQISPRSLKGDLDWIVMKALEKDRSRRYETANGFAMDVRRFLEQEPVLAGPPGIGYKMRKFVRRNRSAVAVAATITFLLIAGIFGTSWFAMSSQRATVSSQRANKALAVKMAKEAEAALIKSRYDEAKTWLERARIKKLEKNEFGAALMAAKALGFRGFGAERQPPEFRKNNPVLLDKEQPEFKELMQIAMSAGGSSWPLWQSPISGDAGQPVLCVAFSPDGTTMASGGEDATIRLWNVSTGKEFQSLQGHQGPVTSVSFSPDGTTLASGSEDKTVRLWDAATGKEIRILQGHQQGLRSVTFSPDGATLASASGDSTITLWNLSTGKEIQSLEGHRGGVWSVAFSPDGNIVASGSKDRTVKLWDISTGAEIRALRGHRRGVTSVAFSPGGTILASGSGDETIKIWMVTTGKEIQSLPGHGGRVQSVAFSPDGVTLASGSGDGTTRLWNVLSATLIETLRAHQGYVQSVAFSPDGATLASGSSDKTIKLWKISSRKEMQSLEGHQGKVLSVAFSPDGATLASGSADETMKLWNLASGKEIRSVQGHQGKVRSVAFSPGGSILASGSHDKTIKLWRPSTGEEIRSLPGHQHLVTSVAFSPDGATLASGSEDDSVIIWDVSTSEEIRSLRGHHSYVQSVAFSPNGATLASGSSDNTIKLWNLSTGKEIQSPGGHGSTVQSVAFSPDGATLASGSSDNTIKLWNLSTRRKIQSLEGHQGRVMTVAFSPDGAILASGSEDKTVKLWNVTTGEEIRSLPGHEDWVESVAFSPDGNTLASGGGGTIRLWLVGYPPLDLARYVDTRDPWCQFDRSQIVWTTRIAREIQVKELANAAKKMFEKGLNNDAMRSLTEALSLIGENEDNPEFREVLLSIENLRPQILAAQVEPYADAAKKNFGIGHHDDAMRELNEAMSLIGRNEKNARIRRLLFSLETLALQVLAEQLVRDPGREIVWLNLATLLEATAPTGNLDVRDNARQQSGVIAHVIWTALAKNGSAASAERVKNTLLAVPDMPELLKFLQPDKPLDLNGVQFSIPAPLRVEILRQQGKPEEALALIDRQLEAKLEKTAYPFYHAARAEILEDLGRVEEAAVAFGRAMALMQDGDKLPATVLLMKNAALLVWFGKGADHAAMCKRIIAAAADTKDAAIADAVAKLSCLAPIDDAAVRADALAIARRALELKAYVWYEMGLGIAEYRSGNYPAAEQALSKAVEGAQRERESFRARIMGTASYYRVMSLFKRDRQAEARELFMGTQATMKPLPFFEQHPLAGGADHDDLILWLAYKEAASLLGISALQRAGPVITFQQGVNSGFGVYSSGHYAGLRGGAPDSIEWMSRLIVVSNTQALLRFDDIFGKGPGAIPPGARINSATLRLHVFNPGPKPSIHQMATAWDPKTLTHNTALLNGNVLPGIQADNLEALETPAGDLPHGNRGAIDIDVTSSVQNWSDGAGNFGWVLRRGHSSNSWTARANEVDPPSSRPKLIIDYDPAAENE